MADSSSQSPTRDPRVHRVPGAARLVEGEVRKVLLENGTGEPPTEVALCRLNGRIYAVDSLCPHEGGRLAAGPMAGGRYLSCPLHLYKFDPKTGESVGVECDPARTYEAREVDGEVEITLTP